MERLIGFLFALLVGATLFTSSSVAQTNALVLDRAGGTLQSPALFSVDLTNANRTLITDFGNRSEGIDLPGAFSVVVESTNTALVTGLGRVVRVDLATGQRALLGDGGLPSTPPGVTVVGVFQGVAVEASGQILVTDMRGFTTNGISSASGLLLRLDPTTGGRTLVSDFTDANQGPIAFWPLGIALESPAQALVFVHHFRSDALDRGGVFRVDLTTGQRILLTDFNDAAQGALSVGGPSIAIDGSRAFVTGTDLLAIDRSTGFRTLLTSGATAWPQRSATSIAVSTSGILVSDNANTVFLIDPSTGDASILNNQFTNAISVAVPPTGPTTTPFETSNTRLAVQTGPFANDDTFTLVTSFTLGADSNGIDLTTDAVNVVVGNYSVTIPAGFFMRGQFFFGTINGVRLTSSFIPQGGNSYTFQITGQGVDLSTIANPVPVTVTIGDDSSTTNVSARIR